MKIAIIADVHDNLANLTKVLNYLKKIGINFLICCGDTGNIETISFLANNFKGQIYFAFGNVENDLIKKENLNFSNLTYYTDCGKIEMDGKIIAFCHFPNEARQLANEKVDIIFYGHTHQPKEELINEIKLVNPGNVAGLFFRPTFTLYDTELEDLQLKLIDLL